MATKTRVIDRGHDHIVAQMRAATGLRVKVGWMGAKIHKNRDGKPATLTTPEIAAVNEFGSRKRKIPARPMLRPTADRNRRRYGRMLGVDAIGKISAGATAKSVLEVFGELAAGDVVETINRTTKPKNAASTIRRKGSSHPLIDTGLLRASVAQKLVSK